MYSAPHSPKAGLFNATEPAPLVRHAHYFSRGTLAVPPLLSVTLRAAGGGALPAYAYGHAYGHTAAVWEVDMAIPHSPGVPLQLCIST